MWFTQKGLTVHGRTFAVEPVSEWMHCGSSACWLWSRLKVDENVAGIKDGNGFTTHGSWTVSSECFRQQQLL
jgi:hypothetical protein